jgi:hypothetical protein
LIQQKPLTVKSVKNSTLKSMQVVIFRDIWPCCPVEASLHLQQETNIKQAVSRADSSERLAELHWTMRHYIPQDRTRNTLKTFLQTWPPNFKSMLEDLRIKDILVAARGGPWGCEMLRVPYFLDNRLTDGGEVMSLMRWPPFTPRRFLVFISIRSLVDHTAIVQLEG